MIGLKYGGFIEINNVYFYDNFMFETTFNATRGNMIYLYDFMG